MFVAIKEGDRFLVGYTMKDHNVNSEDSDMLLEENLPVFKVRGKKGVMIFCRETGFAASKLKYNKELFKFEICDKAIFGSFVKRLRRFLEENDLIDRDGSWNNELLIINQDAAYFIDNKFSITKYEDYCVSYSWKKLTMGSLTDSVGEKAEKRIIDAYKLVYKMKGENLFPISICDSKTGKRKIINSQSFGSK